MSSCENNPNNLPGALLDTRHLQQVGQQQYYTGDHLLHCTDELKGENNN